MVIAKVNWIGAAALPTRHERSSVRNEIDSTRIIARLATTRRVSANAKLSHRRPG
jgi:hypothetical protein